MVNQQLTDYIKQQLPSSLANSSQSPIENSSVGRNGICKFTDMSNLMNLLNNWQKGISSRNDFKDIDCSGEYFGKGEQPANISQTIKYQKCIDQKGNAMENTSAGTACFKNQIDLGTLSDYKINGKNSQCCASK